MQRGTMTTTATHHTPTQLEAKTLELWQQGHGTGSIALHLKVPSRVVFAIAKRHGLRRSKDEMLALRRANGLKFHGASEPKILRR